MSNGGENVRNQQRWGNMGTEWLGHVFEKGSTERQLVRLVLPILGSIIVGLLDASVNAMWVGQYLGDAALAAVSNVNTLLLFLFAGISGICVAVSIRVGFYLGGSRPEETKRLIRATIWFLGAGGAVVPIIVVLLREPLLQVLSVPGDAMLLARQYLDLILLSVPPIYVYEMVTAVLRGAGDTKTAFCFSVIAVALDTVLNPVFIFGFGALPRMGVAGSALATVLAQWIALGGLVGSLYLRRHSLCLRVGEFGFRPGDSVVIRELLRQGGPMGMEFLWYSILAMLLITLVNQFGSDVTAAYGAVVQLWGYVLMPSAAVTLAITSMIAQSLGARREDRVHEITRLGVTSSVITTGILLLLLELMNRSAFALFLPAGSPALAIASHINRIASWSWVLYAGYSTLLSTPRAAGAVWGPASLTVAAGAAQLPIAALLLRICGTEGIWLSFPISSAIAAVVAVRYYRRGSWRAVRLRVACL
jgi:putative MATE family efflux protein